MSVDTRRNPWLPAPPIEEAAEATETGPQIDPATGPRAPQGGVTAPDYVDRLGKVEVPPADLFVVGTHGGAGETSLAELQDGWVATGHRWPVAAGPASRVLLTARSSMRGLESAQKALTEWGAGEVDNVEVVGLVVIADAPGRLPRSIREACQVIGGGAPRQWTLPWIEAWRLGRIPDADAGPRELKRLIEALGALTVPSRTEHLD